MNTEKAIKELNSRIELANRMYVGLVPEYIEALELAVEALRKQAPVKPKACHIEAMYHGWHYGQVRTKALVRFCPNCGQKIDWEED